MSEVSQLKSQSPPTLANFVIPYDNDVSLIENFEKEGLFKFIRENSLVDVNVTDSSFFPRAVTELDVDFESNLNGQTAELVIQKCDPSKKMEVGNFQPRVISSNSNQRSGPDGSPALCPPRSQGFVNSSNLSETSELFAPVRTLTFSDVESSHVEDSYINSSRFVSSPEQVRTEMRNFDFGVSTLHQNDKINLDMRQTNEAGNRSILREDSGSRESSPEFRQLDGEDHHDDNGLLGTGTFKPTFHGINQEFLDNFTGKTRTSDHFVGEIFSPLARKAYTAEETERKTPPLHSPAPNSPYAKQFANQGITVTRHMDRDDDDDEIQFQMSPTRSSTNPHAIKVLSNTNNSNKKPNSMMNFLRENTFQPIDKGHQSFMAHRNVPRNLNDYLQQETDDQKQIHHLKRYDDGRRGDGVEVNDDRPMDESHFDRQFSEMSSEDFEQRYLRKKQVSVKLPQATYDTMTGEFVMQDPNRGEPAGLPPDSLEDEVKLDSYICGADLQTDSGSITEVVTSGPTSYNKELQLRNHDEMVTYSNKSVMEKSDKSQINIKTNLNKHDQREIQKNSNPVRKSTDQEDLSLPACSSSSMTTGDAPASFVMIGSSQNVVTKSTNEDSESKQTISQQPDSLSSQTTMSQSTQPSSRLLQETISQRNKTNQKYVSTVPGVSKSAANQQNKEIKKPVDYVVRNANSAMSGLGARKTTGQPSSQGQGVNSNVNPNSKLSDKQKSKTMSTESLAQKQFNPTHSQNQPRPSAIPGHSNPQTKQSQATSQVNRSRMNQGHPMPDQREIYDSHDLSSHSMEDMKVDARVVTQVQNTSPVPEPRASKQFVQFQHAGDQSLDVRGMEDVRMQLKSMLKLSTDTMAPHDRSHYEHSDIVAGFGMDYSNPQVLPQQPPVDMSWNMYRKPNEEEMVEKFPSFSSQFMVDSGNVSRSDVSLHTENQRLKEMCEKERYRRKHCEQYIQQLNMKILEIQQQLAVAVSTDKRKDLMIEQLDKQLALVVEGWRKRDAEKDEMLGKVQQEKCDIENNLCKQQEMIERFEHDMSEAVDALREEREKSAQAVHEMKEKISEAERNKAHAEELLSVEKEKGQIIQTECDNLRESRENLDKKLEQMQRRLHREQDEWFQREQELLQRIEEVGEKNTKILQMERAKSDEQGKIAEEVVEKLQESHHSIKKLEMELDAALREKESIKVEMGIMEAKFENAQRVLETDLQSQMEKQIANQIQDVQHRYERAEDQMREKHNAQVLELSHRQNKESEKQMAMFRDQMAKKEDEHRKQLQELETSLLEYRNENSELKLAKQKLESTRLEILTKLQYAMQTQWNEALSLLVATPQRKSVNNTLLAEEDGNFSSISAQPSLSSVNFNLPARPSSQNHSEKYAGSPPRSNQRLDGLARSSSQNDYEKYAGSPPRSHQRLDSPERSLVNHNEGYQALTNQESRIKKGRADGDGVGGDSDVTVEDTALSHMKDFQDYMNRLAETPEWISALTRQNQDTDAQKPLPQDISTLLSTYLAQQPEDLNDQSRQSIDNHQPDTANQITASHNLSNYRVSQPQSHASNQVPFSSYEKTVNQIPASSQVTQKQPDISSQKKAQIVNQKAMLPPAEALTPPRQQTMGSFPQNHYGESNLVNSHSDSVIFGGMVQSSSPMYEDTGLSRAVAIRPPQQGDDPYINNDGNDSIISSIAGGHMEGFFQGGQCFSPPTRQRKGSFNDSTEDLNTNSNRLNEDYSHLSERMEKHETHQNDLQKYIQMLLGKPQTETEGQENDSSLSQDCLLDLNDTAQAAQLQKELDRIQELRERQEYSSKAQSMQAGKPSSTKPHQPHDKHSSMKPAGPSDQSKILNEDQLSEITRLLNAVKDRPQTGNQHIGELLNALKHVEIEKGNQPEIKKTKGPADRPKPFPTGTKKNVQFHPGKGLECNKSQTDNTKSEKPAPRSAQSKKIERKIAGSASKAEKGAKPAAWK